MDYILEMSRIVDGAVKGDRAKVAAYVEQLARKLRQAGDTAAADRLVRTVEQTKTSEMAPASVSTARLPVDNESRLALADEEWFSDGDVEVILEAAIEQQINEFVRYVRAADRLIANRVGISPSMLIYGPPGVGKTELARRIAGELGLPLITARSDSLISSFLGSTAKNLRLLFEHARSRPCVLFLDELDSVAKLRDDQHELGELKRVVVSLLQNIDALANETVLLAATNHHHLLDPAVWRRFTYKLELTAPGIAARRRLFALFLSGYRPSERDADDFAAVAEGMTGDDIRHVCENAIRASVLEDHATADPVVVLRGIVQRRLDTAIDFSSPDVETVHAIHDLDARVFTLKRLAAMFGSSEPTMSRRLKPGGNHARRRRKTAN